MSKLKNNLFFIFLILFFYIQGPYIEIPSDNVGVHLFKIFKILKNNKILNLEQIDLKNSLMSGSNYFSYSIAAMFDRFLPFDWYTKLNITSVFFQTLLCLSIYNCSLFLLKDKFFSSFSIFLFMLIMGIDGYSFLRYYTFAPVMISMCVYLEILISGSFLFKMNRIRKLDVSYIIISIVAILLIHKQEVMFLIIQYAFLLLFYFIGSKHEQVVKISTIKSLLFFIIAIFILLLIYKYVPVFNKVGQVPLLIENYSLIPEYLYLNIFGNKNWIVADFYSNILFNEKGYNRIQAFFDKEMRVIFLISISLSLVLIVYMKNKLLKLNFRFFFIIFTTFTPYVFLTFPYTSTFWAHLVGDSVYYRLLYASPIYILLPFVLKMVTKKLKFINRKLYFTFPILLMISLIILSFNSVRGKANHAFSFIRFDYKDAYWMNLINAVNEFKSQAGINHIYFSSSRITSYELLLLTRSFSTYCQEEAFRCNLDGMENIIPINFKFSENKELILNSEIILNNLIININEYEIKSPFAYHWDESILVNANKNFKKSLQKYMRASEIGLYQLEYNKNKIYILNQKLYSKNYNLKEKI